MFSGKPIFFSENSEISAKRHLPWEFDDLSESKTSLEVQPVNCNFFLCFFRCPIKSNAAFSTVESTLRLCRCVHDAAFLTAQSCGSLHLSSISHPCFILFCNDKNWFPIVFWVFLNKQNINKLMRLTNEKNNTKNKKWKAKKKCENKRQWNQKAKTNQQQQQQQT